MRRSEFYDEIGGGYRTTRMADPRIAKMLWDALGDARSVLNVGAGAGAYEPPDRDVIAIEPSATMIAQRQPSAATVIQARAEALPLEDKSVDAALAVQTLHHWKNLDQGLRELRRVVRKRVIVFMYDPTDAPLFWLFEEYLPILKPHDLIPVRAAVGRNFPQLATSRVPIPSDCRDGFLTAFWARPEAYLDPNVRANMSAFIQGDQQAILVGLDSLSADLKSGAWDRKYGTLRELQELFLGHRILSAEL